MPTVLFVAPTLTRGGMERQLSYLLKGINKEQFTIKLALLKPKVYYEIPQNIEVVYLDYKPRNLPFYLRLAKLIISHRKDLIVSRISGTNEMMMLVCGLLFINKLILEIRNSGRELYPNYMRMKRYFNIFPYKWQVVCNNIKAVEEVNGFVPNRIEVNYIRNGLDTDRFFPLKRSSNEICSIGYAGRVIRRKNVETIIKALTLLEFPCTFRIKGKTDEDSLYVQELRDLIVELDLESIISWEEPSDDIQNFYQDLDLFILASTAEGSPNVLLEAMSSECVVFCSEDANTEEFLDQRYVFETFDSEMLAHKIKTEYFDLDENKIRKIRRRNRRTVEEGYSIKSMVQAYSELFIKYQDE